MWWRARPLQAAVSGRIGGAETAGNRGLIAATRLPRPSRLEADDATFPKTHRDSMGPKAACRLAGTARPPPFAFLVRRRLGCGRQASAQLVVDHRGGDDVATHVHRGAH